MSIVRIIMLLALTSFLANCSMFGKSEEDEKAEIARFKDYYPSDVYTELAEDDSDRSPASYEDDNYAAADEDPADSRNDEQSAYLDKALETEEEMDKGKDTLPVDKAEKLAAVDLDGIEDAPLEADPEAMVAPPVKFKNGIKKFFSECDMRSKPDSGSKVVGVIKGTQAKPKKLWVENHNAAWAKVYKKSGAVYIDKGCL